MRYCRLDGLYTIYAENEYIMVREYLSHLYSSLTIHNIEYEIDEFNNIQFSAEMSMSNGFPWNIYKSYIENTRWTYITKDEFIDGLLN